MVTVGLIVLVLVQRVCCYRYLFRRLLVLRVLAPVSRDARSGRLCSLTDALPRGRMSRL